MRKFVAVLLLIAACFAVFVGSPLFRPEAKNANVWQIVRYTLGAASLDGAALFAADADGDGSITLSDALHLALKEG